MWLALLLQLAVATPPPLDPTLFEGAWYDTREDGDTIMFTAAKGTWSVRVIFYRPSMDGVERKDYRVLRGRYTLRWETPQEAEGRRREALLCLLVTSRWDDPIQRSPLCEPVVIRSRCPEPPRNGSLELDTYAVKRAGEREHNIDARFWSTLTRLVPWPVVWGPFVRPQPNCTTDGLLFP